MRKFTIQTLQDGEPGGGGMDPISIITGGVALLSSVFPNLFGGGRKRLTSQDWLQLFPGGGYWTTNLRNSLANSIHYDSDLKNIEKYTGYFVWENRSTICPEVPSSCFPYDNPHLCPDCMNKFFTLINKEKTTGGQSPVGSYPGGWGSINYEQVIVYGGIAVLAIALLTKKKK